VALPSPGLSERLAHYTLDFEDDFSTAAPEPTKWIPFYLPQWVGSEAARARWEFSGGRLNLQIEHDQPSWSPDLTGGMVVSNFQTGVRSGPTGSGSGQHPFRPDLVVVEARPEQRLYLPHRGIVQIRMAALADPSAMVALWLIGFEDVPTRSAEICVAEIFGRNVGPNRAAVGMGVHPFADPAISDDFAEVELALDAREFHDYAIEWTDDEITWFVDDAPVRNVAQSPDYPMQLMLDIFEDRPAAAELGHGPEHYPKRFAVEYVRGYRRITLD
jgi:Glycosyl hydrolases family 16